MALDDYRRKSFDAGIGPENLVVHNCRNLSQRIPLETDQSLRQRQLRLLRNLQNLLIKFQLEAGEQVRAWVNDDGSVDFFEEADTDAGSSLHEEGEENEKQMMISNLVET